MNWILVRDLVRRALQEDIGSGDLTTGLVVSPEREAKATIICKTEAVIAGLPVAGMVFQELDSSFEFRREVEEGAAVAKGTRIASLRGSSGTILTGERCALNFLQRLSGIATLTTAYVKGLRNPNVKIMDTRKTTPLLRPLEKYAVRVGGGHNHRSGLFDGILIKDNHIAVAGGIEQAVSRAKIAAPHQLRVQVEVTSPQEARQAIEAGADALLLDNMRCEEMAQVASLAPEGVILEASGNVSLENVGAISETGVHLISVGAITHSAPAVDMTLTILS